MKEGRTWRLCCQWPLASGHWPPGAPGGCGGRAECTRSPSKAPGHALPCLPPNPRDKVPTVGTCPASPPNITSRYLEFSGDARGSLPNGLSIQTLQVPSRKPRKETQFAGARMWTKA